ncbi:hypothetical protein WR25_12741 [Diploscapter pachys]|uniref:Homeobox domain-containing protein n=1 Tax=Diploscapter pachys TaxID=2018661 RepID=A0A2A2JVI3_9BILA|nr:hypothetical protein WR25_12741 [Diploscapter pachys]
MSMDGVTGSPPRYKYAIVRVKETSIVDFFGLIASKGYSDVSFVSNLQQAIARPDPNDLSEGPSSKPDDRQVADSEDRCSPSGSPDDLQRVVVTSSVPVTMPQPSCPSSVSSALNHLGLSQLIVPKPEASGTGAIVQTATGGEGNEDENEVGPSNRQPTNTDMLANTVPAELLHNLFGKHIPGLSESWLSGADLGIIPTMILPRIDKPHPYKQEGTLQTRMKGWQREYIKEVINNGHYPTEDELKDIEQKCDLSRKQVLRFIAKRLVNPNRRPRVNHHIEKMNEKMQMKMEEEALAAGMNSNDDGDGDGDGDGDESKSLSISPV